MVQLLVDHRRVICSLAVVLKFWLDRVDARRQKSFQVYVNLLLQQLSSVTSTAHSRSASQAWVRLRSVLSRGSVRAFPRTWAKPVRTHSAWRLQVVDVKPSPADSWPHDICSDCFSLLHAAQIGAGTLVARTTNLRQTSSTVMLPQIADLFVHASRYTQRWPVHATCRCTSGHHA